MIQALLSAITFYLLPILTGRLVMANATHRLSILPRLAVYFSSGALLLYGIILAVGFAIPGIVSADIFRAGAIIAAILILALNVFKRSQTRVNTQTLLLTGGLILLTGAIYTLWRWNSPYPSPLNWDIHEHQVLINAIVHGHIHFQTSALSDTFTFNGYTTMFHALAALPQSMFQPANLGFWWMIEGLHLATTIATSYAVGYAISKKRAVGILTAILGAFTFESTVAYTSLFFLPQTLAATLGALSLAGLIEAVDNARGRWVLALPIVTLFLLHYIIGVASIAVFAGYFILAKLHQSHRIAGLVLKTIGVIILIVSAVYAAGSIIDFRTLNSGEATMFWHTLVQKIGFAQSFYGNALFLFFPLGAIAAFHQKEERAISVTLLSLIGGAVVLAPFPYALKFYVIMRYLIHAVMALGIWSIFSLMRLRITKIIAATIGIAVLGIVFIVNTEQWKYPSLFEGVSTQVSSDEQNAAIFLKTKKAADAYLVSDPATQYILENLSGINSQGGAYMQKSTRAALYALLANPSRTDIQSRTSAIHDMLDQERPTVLYLVMNNRTLQWMDLPQEERFHLGINIWAPSMASLRDVERFNEWEATTGISPVYSNSSMRIYEIPVVEDEL